MKHSHTFTETKSSASLPPLLRPQRGRAANPHTLKVIRGARDELFHTSLPLKRLAIDHLSADNLRTLKDAEDKLAEVRTALNRLVEAIIVSDKPDAAAAEPEDDE